MYVFLVIFVNTQLQFSPAKNLLVRENQPLMNEKRSEREERSEEQSKERRGREKRRNGSSKARSEREEQN
jgi:hypothetical protein